MKNKNKYIGYFAGIILLISGVYLLMLFLAPAINNVPIIGVNQNQYNPTNDAFENINRIQIPKIGIEVPFSTGGSEVLELGAWHRLPENGNPKEGGNFVLAAHRLEIGWTPGQTVRKSPFYKIDKLSVGDEITVVYENNKYNYKVNKIYSVHPTAVEIESRSQNAKLTLYTCTLNGAADGRIVIEATPI